MSAGSSSEPPPPPRPPKASHSLTGIGPYQVGDEAIILGAWENKDMG